MELPTLLPGPKRIRWLLLAVAIGATGLGVYLEYKNAAHKQSIEPGCAFEDIAIPAAGAQLLELPPELRSTNGVFRQTLSVRYADHIIGGCKVHHRSYNGLLTSATWRVKPGDTLQVHLSNDLPLGLPTASSMFGDPMHGNSNGTNLHTHGLHVSPEGNSDNPFINVQPGKSFDYEIRIPKDHPPGTHWYHPHLHGGTAVQQSSGMSGALIVEGGLDEVPEIKAAKEQVLILQQITYDETGAYFSPSWTAFQADRGRDFSVIVDGVSN